MKCRWGNGISTSRSPSIKDPDIADLIYLVTYMFQEGPEPVCMDAADVNGNGTETPDIADLIYLVTFMFQDGPAPVACP
jgi:hypothetical protein